MQGYNPTLMRRGSSKKKQPQSSLTRQKLLDFLARSAEVERKLEIIKEMLAEEELFTPATLFHRLDVARKGSLSPRDVQVFMSAQNFELKGCELKMLYGRMSTGKQEDGLRLRE